jgi:hypothetical protein
MTLTYDAVLCFRDVLAIKKREEKRRQQQHLMAIEIRFLLDFIMVDILVPFTRSHSRSQINNKFDVLNYIVSTIQLPRVETNLIKITLV